MRLLLVVCCLMHIFSGVRAQTRNVRFYDHSEGLESKWVGTIKTSNDGEIWFVNNDDLIRYNGYKKQVIRLKHPDGEPVYVNSFVIGDHEIWIATQERLIHYNLLTLEQQNFEVGAVGALYLDANRLLWASSEKGLITVDSAFNISFHQDKDNWGSLAIFDLVLDGNGLLWISTVNRGLLTYDPFNQVFGEIQGLHDINGNAQLKMRDLLLDRDGSIWAGSSGGGLFHINDGNIRQFLPSEEPGSISTTEAYTLEQDNSGNLWIGTWAGGLNVLEVSTDQFVNYRAGADQKNGLPSNVIVDLQIVDDQLWLGTAYSDIWMTQLSDQAFTWWNTENSPVPLDYDNFWSIHEDSSKNLWLGTYQGGLYRISPDQQVKHYQPFIDLPANTVWSLFENQFGLWIGTHRGLLFKPSEKEDLTFFSTSANTPEGWWFGPL